MRRQDEKVKALQAEHQTLYTWRPAKVVGDPGGLAGLTKMAKDLKLTPEQERAVKLAYVQNGPQAAQQYMQSIGQGGQMPTTAEEIARANFDLTRRVDIPGNLGGGRAWAAKADTQTATQDALRSTSAILNNYARLRKIVLSGTRLSADDRLAVKQIGADNIIALKDAAKLGVMSDSDRELMQPLSGESINDMSLADREKLLDTAEALVRQKSDGYLETLSADPAGTTMFRRQIRSRKAQ
jgi:hypothetical protein